MHYSKCEISDIDTINVCETAAVARARKCGMRLKTF